jgi:hypothetical protein
MIIIKLQGGLGNQLFQWAFGVSRQRLSKEVLKFDDRSYMSDNLRMLELTKLVSNIEIANLEEISIIRKERNVLSLLQRKVNSAIKPYYKRNVVCEKTYLYDVDLDKSMLTNVYFEGYWQNEKYFLKYRNEILKSLNFKMNSSLSFVNLKNEITSDKDSVAIHVRRGDYILDKRLTEIHGVCGLDYYKKAIEKMSGDNPNGNYYIFSNDIGWCRENFQFLSQKKIIDSTKTVFEDLELMSLCKHQIIANSSLSWWAAWINKNDNKCVIAPEKWFNITEIDYSELIPKDWVKI